MIASSRRTVVARTGSAAMLMAAVLCVELPDVTRAEEASKSAAPMAARITALIPDLEAYIRSGMKAYDVPGVAVGIVNGERLVYAKGFGVRSKSGGVPVDTRTVFQIGSLTKGFLAATMALLVDRGKLNWDDRVVDLHPGFQLKDPWVTREFRAFDLVAQRSGLPPQVNHLLGLSGYPEPALIRSLRHVEPVSSFRTTFAYTNVTHLLAGRIVSDLAGAPDWSAVARRELLDPLGMAQTSFTAEGSRPRPITRRATAGRRTEPSRCRSSRCFRMVTAPPATSIPPSRTWPGGFACSLGTAASRDGASCRRKTSPICAGPRSRSTTIPRMGWPGC
jgi:CubicO group peptidase (beta-lactamase class C family)